MSGRAEASRNLGRKNVWRPVAGNVGVKAVELGQAAAQYDDFRVENVDDLREGSCQTFFIALQGRFARRVAGTGAGGNFLAGQIFAAVPQVIAREAGA